MSELKPCPFCGGEAELHEISFWEEWQYYVRCTQCQVKTARYYYDEAEAEEAWNARVIPEGYVKVVRCGECKYLEERTIAEFDKEHPCKTMYICKSPHSHMIAISRCNKDYYCSEGESKEDANLSSVEEQMCQAKEDTNDAV